MQHRELTCGEQRAIRYLVKEKCANYDEQYGCLPLNGACYMFGVYHTGVAMCRYFRQSVLPENPSLEAVLSGVCETKPCRICGAAFAPIGRQAYCSAKCRDTGKRLATVARVRKHRRRKEANVTK